MDTDQLIIFLASNKVSISYAIDEIISKHNDYQDTLLNYLRDIIEDTQLQNTINQDKNFNAFGKISNKLDIAENAILWIGKKILPQIIAKYRCDYLKKSFSVSRPKPYDHPDLLDLNIDKNNLAEMKQFEVDRSGSICKGNTSFRIIQSIPSSNNSMYWTFRRIFDIENYGNIKIRLDPFIYSPIGGYLPPQYKMFVYGKPPAIDELHLIKDEVHVRWMSDDINDSCLLFTDAVWQRRDEEVHFICEEIPKPEYSNYRGSRYFHSIYSLQESSFIHIDGAIRLYEQGEIDIRSNEHVRKIGKTGKRLKLFQIDQYINLDQWSNIAASFFVWNCDVSNYFCYE